MNRFLDVLFAPAEFEALAARDLSDTTCVVFDILRATTSMIAALDAGAASIVPVADIPEALEKKRRCPEALLAGERDGVRIEADVGHGTGFDFGNSPREFTPDRVRDRTIIMTTTNGTRALRSAAHAACVYPGAFLNLGTLADQLLQQAAERLIVICGGTYEEASFEDTLAAGALCDRIWAGYGDGHVSDSVRIALELHRRFGHDLVESMRLARNGRRLLAHPELHLDVPFSMQPDRVALLAMLDPDGHVRRHNVPCGP